MVPKPKDVMDATFVDPANIQELLALMLLYNAGNDESTAEKNEAGELSWYGGLSNFCRDITLAEENTHQLEGTRPLDNVALPRIVAYFKGRSTDCDPRTEYSATYPLEILSPVSVKHPFFSPFNSPSNLKNFRHLTLPPHSCT
jgi:hypothetical protein